MRLLPSHFLCALFLLFVRKTNAFDCNQHANGQKIFTKSNTDHCIFAANATGFTVTDWAKFKEACRYTDKDRIEGYALRLGVLSKAKPSDVLEYIRHFENQSVAVGITANGSLPTTFAYKDAMYRMRKYFRWEDGTEVADELWRDNEPNNDRYQSQDYGSFHEYKLCDVELTVTANSFKVCEIYPYKKSAMKKIPVCASKQFKINEPCNERLLYRETTEDEASQLCARRHPISSQMYDHDAKSFQCQYEAYAPCREDEFLIFNKCYKFHNEKKTKNEAEQECRKAKTALPYVTSKSHAKFLSVYAAESSIDTIWIALKPSGEKEDGQTGYNRINPAQIAFGKMVTVDPLTTDEIEVPLEGRAAVILRTSDYLNTPVGLFDRVDKDYTSAFVCEREPDESDGRSVIEQWCTFVNDIFNYETFFVRERCYIKSANFYQRQFEGDPIGTPSFKACKMFDHKKFFSRNAILMDFTQLADLRALREERMMVAGLRTQSIRSRSTCCDPKAQQDKYGVSCVTDADREDYSYINPADLLRTKVPPLWEPNSPGNDCSDFFQGSVGVAYYVGKLYDVSPLQSMRLLCEHGAH